MPSSLPTLTWYFFFFFLRMFVGLFLSLFLFLFLIFFSFSFLFLFPFSFSFFLFLFLILFSSLSIDFYSFNDCLFLVAFYFLSCPLKCSNGDFCFLSFSITFPFSICIPQYPFVITLFWGHWLWFGFSLILSSFFFASLLVLREKLENSVFFCLSIIPLQKRFCMFFSSFHIFIHFYSFPPLFSHFILVILDFYSLPLCNYFLLSLSPVLGRFGYGSFFTFSFSFSSSFFSPSLLSSPLLLLPSFFLQNLFQF